MLAAQAGEDWRSYLLHPLKKNKNKNKTKQNQKKKKKNQHRDRLFDLQHPGKKLKLVVGICDPNDGKQRPKAGLSASQSLLNIY
jgi:curved DNA-binding protein CbpA